eukprot:GEMP01017113.1.p1 GENE.GEMP01017113.1~~GEMP01017113.1.p1  ORF type:complete len:705 (+),score=201.73 GEMP01017113.1:26-2116(+)
MSEVEKKDEMEVEKTTEEQPMEEQPTDVEKVDETKKDAVDSNEKEADSPADSSARHAGAIEMSSLDATLNCMISDKCVVQSLSIDGQPFVAATRANIGLTDGRYLFELEVLDSRGQHSEIRVGFSCVGSSLFLGQKDNLCFTSHGAYFVDGEKVSSFRGRRFAKGDVIGLLLNRTESGNEKTVSLFQNGKRIGEPQAIPESFDGALFPHVSVKLSMVKVNLTKESQKKLPFEARLIADANADDVTNSPIKKVADSKVVVPIGFDSSEYVQDYIEAHNAEHFVQITPAAISQWQEQSGWTKCPLEKDASRCLMRMIALRNRNYIYSLGHNLLSADREQLVKDFPSSLKKTFVVDPTIINKLPFNTSFANDVSLPTAAEGFTVEHVDGEAKSKTALQQWQKRCKQQTIVKDLKAGEYFKEHLTKYEKIREATRASVEKQKKEAAEAERKAKLADKEGAEEKEKTDSKEEKKEEEEKEGEEKVPPSDVDTMNFSEEDWMLCDLRVELHLLCHAFREDVEDKDRVGFAAEHLVHYYKLYHDGKKTFSVAMFGAKSVAECVEIIADTVDVVDGMLMPQHDRAISLDFIIQQVEEARQTRSDRIGAGDEGATLKFKARRAAKGAKGQHRTQNFTSKGASKGHNVSHSSGAKGRNSYQQQNPPTSFRSGKGASYQMRPIPQQGGGYKRPEQSGFQQSAAKRFR